LLGTVAFTERGAMQMNSWDFSRYALTSCVAQRHSVMETQPGLSKLLDILDADDRFSFGVN
jgi:hypothetical protein